MRDRKSFAECVTIAIADLFQVAGLEIYLMMIPNSGACMQISLAVQEGHCDMLLVVN